jgi:putative transposase
MYNYRKMSEEERHRIVAYRRECRRPWHSPPRSQPAETKQYFVTAACFNHATIIGKTTFRLSECERGLLATCRDFSSEVYAWCMLPNHYHLLIETGNLETLVKELGLFHGRMSYQWNGEDDQRGRQVWYRAFDRRIRNERHFWATVNYIHHNPVNHGYVDKWTDWIWSSAGEFLESVGREKAIQIWRDYPIRDYGKGWDI